MADLAGFYDILTAAINDMMEHGFDSQERVDRWLKEIERAAKAALIPEYALAEMLRKRLGTVFKRTASTSKLMKRNKGVSEFTLDMVKPKLRAELDRRILASANLIKLNREASIARTLQRFSGWATSIPIGGTDVVKRKEVKQKVRRGIAGLPFEERRVVIDQSFKLIAAVNEIVATDGGAIAGRWSHVPEGPPEYDARPVHEKRNGKIFLIRNSWAHKQGLVKPLSVGFTDEVEMVGELPYCRCSYQYLYSPSELPPAMLTDKGKAKLREARAAIRGLSDAT